MGKPSAILQLIWVARHKIFLHITIRFYINGEIDGLVQDYNSSIANALELLQSYTKPSKLYKTP